MAAQDDRSSIQHILTSDAPIESPNAPLETPNARREDATGTMASSPPPSSVQDDGDDEGGRDLDGPQYSSLTQTTRRNANGSVSSVFSGNKIKHLKKEDGVPLWRKDIQFDLLQAIFEDDKRCFTRLSDGSKDRTFAEVYIDTLASSSKTSKILKEKLIQDRESAITMAMVCLLVNVGRMNTTLNFFPEMRAQLRTYHAIPALQAHQDPHAYKQLQDAPRLKSILKGASEDEPQPGTMEELRAAQRPRTNAVNLIFVLAQYAPKVSELHFTPPRDFFDLVMRTTLSSKSRARAFLWLMWWYLESDFTAEDALRNPFGAGTEGEGSGGLPIKLPPLEVLTEEQAAMENLDTEEEKTFGEAKRKERISIVNSEPSPAMTALKRARKERSIFRPGYVPSEHEEGMTPSGDMESPMAYGSMQHYYDSDGGSPSPPASVMSGVNAGRPNATPLASVLGVPGTPSGQTPSARLKAPGKGNPRRGKLAPTTSHTEHTTGDASLQLSPTRHSVLPAFKVEEIMARAGHLGTEEKTSGNQGSKKSRPLTSHQLKINEYRQSRIVRILDRGVQAAQVEARKKRLREGGVFRAWKRIRSLPPGWDSDEEESRAATEAAKEEEAGGNNSRDKTGGDDGEAWRLFGKAFRPNLPRTPGAVYMAGYVLPAMREVEDAGEQAGHVARGLGAALHKVRVLGEARGFRRRAFVRRKSEVEVYAEALERDTWDLGDRPRLVRKNAPPTTTMGTGAVVKKKEGEEEKEDEGAVAGELDEEDRELLGEVDADDSEDDEVVAKMEVDDADVVMA